MPTTDGNLAAWQHEAKGSFTVKETELWEPGDLEVRIKASHHSNAPDPVS
jgi:hypothetical protein